MSHPTTPTLDTVDDVAALFGLTRAQTFYWVRTLEEGRRYREFEIPKRKAGESRTIAAPIQPISEMQRLLLDPLKAGYTPPSSTHGFVSGRGPKSSAEAHVRKRWLLRLDLEDFFPSIHFGRVRGMFMAGPFSYPPSVATLLAQVCCHKGGLPQGARTSPLISNLICRKLDSQLMRLAGRERLHFTRYADDLTFSTDRHLFPAVIGSRDSAGMVRIGPALRRIIESNGFRVRLEKTRLVDHSQRQRVVGIVVNRKPATTREYLRNVRRVLYVWRVHGRDAAVRTLEATSGIATSPPYKGAPDFESRVLGQVQHVGHVRGWTDESYLRLALELAGLHAFYKGPALHTPRGKYETHVFTEGDSDAWHIAAAAEHFAKLGQFLDLDIRLNPQRTPDGDKGLLKHCPGMKAANPSVPCIALFDSDVAKTTKEASVPGGQFKNWGNGVVSIVMPSPPWRANEDVCIELLHTNEVLQRLDGESRRVFLAEEFDKRTRLDVATGEFEWNQPKQTLVCTSVSRSGKSVALGKTAFALKVFQREAPFGYVDFEGFRATFEQISKAAADARADISRRVPASRVRTA